MTVEWSASTELEKGKTQKGIMTLDSSKKKISSCSQDELTQKYEGMQFIAFDGP